MAVGDAAPQQRREELSNVEHRNEVTWKPLDCRYRRRPYDALFDRMARTRTRPQTDLRLHLVSRCVSRRDEEA